jgi:flagellar export protein FliJ
MARFRFRAAAALDWRRRQEDAAAAQLARAESAFRAATDALEAARASRAEAQQASACAERQGIDAASLEWHRNWISYWSATIARRALDTTRAAAVASDARRVWHEARRKRLALERLRDRALQRHRQAEARLEQIVLDEIGRLRHLAAAAETDASREVRGTTSLEENR